MLLFIMIYFDWCCLSYVLETVCKTGMVLLCGEITSNASVDYQKVVRDTIKYIGYDDSEKGKNDQTSRVSSIWKSIFKMFMCVISIWS